eukprot:2119635-Pleurochrysis_carterae.AAC.3
MSENSSQRELQQIAILESISAQRGVAQGIVLELGILPMNKVHVCTEQWHNSHNSMDPKRELACALYALYLSKIMRGVAQLGGEVIII